jgi:ammonia channel protein AmtB
MQKTGLDQFLEIMLKPDNIPIVGLMVLILFFTWLSFREARKNDQLIEEGRADEVLKKMQE